MWFRFVIFLGLESLQLVQVIMQPPKVVVVLVWYGMSRLLGWELFFASVSFFWSSKGFSSFSSSFECSVILYSLARICLSDLLDEVKGHLICYKHFFNFEVLTPNVEASCTPVGTSCSGIYWVVSRKKCYIKISIINVKWQTYFFGSTLIVPIMTLVWEVVHLIKFSCSCLNKVFT
jgi:hypothetical protein